MSSNRRPGAGGDGLTVNLSGPVPIAVSVRENGSPTIAFTFGATFIVSLGDGGRLTRKAIERESEPPYVSFTMRFVVTSPAVANVPLSVCVPALNVRPFGSGAAVNVSGPVPIALSVR